MLIKINNKDMGRSDLGWLKSIFHFSFADYQNSNNINFGVLRVLNDDLVNPRMGFDTHPHKDMEIISYVVDGELTHGDSMGNKNSLKRGEVQYMSAGRGIYHSEHNLTDEVSRFLQIWIFPDKKEHDPNYGDFRFEWEARVDKWLHIVSNKNGNAQIKINQDVNIYVSEISKNKRLDFDVKDGRQAYMVLIEGKAEINGMSLNERDALEVIQEPINILAIKKSHIIIIEMKK